MANSPSLARKAPMASKFSKAKPSGSMRAWQLAQLGLARCCSIRWRSDAGQHAPCRSRQFRHVRRRRRRRRAEDLLEHPLAALHRRGPRRVRGHGQHAGLRQQPPRSSGWQSHAHELSPVNAVGPGFCRLLAPSTVAVGVDDAVVPGQPLVQEGEVGVDQVEDAAVLADDRLEEQLGLLEHRRPQRLRRSSGTASGRARAVLSCRSCSHCMAKFSHQGRRLRILAASAAPGPRGCASARSLPARSNSSSSGMLLQRKYDSRDAS